MEEKQSCEQHEQPPEQETGLLQLSTNTNSKLEAQFLIKYLTDRQIVACAQVQQPAANSHIEQTDGWLCRFKSSQELLPTLKTELKQFFGQREVHLKITPIVRGSDSFLNWLKSTLKHPTT